MHFFLLAPNLFGYKDGVQVYSGFVLQAVQHSFPEATCNVFLRYERIPSASLRGWQFSPKTYFHCFGESTSGTAPWQRRLKMSLTASLILFLGIRHRPQLNIVTRLNYYTVIAMWLKRLAKVPYWVVLYGPEAWEVQNPAYRQALQQADLIITGSHHTRDRVLSKGYADPEQITVLANTFDATQFHIKPKPGYLLKRYGIGLEQPIILTVGPIQQAAQYKGYDKILRALPQVRQYLPKVRYLLVGEGDDQPRVEALIRELDLEECVTLTGFAAEAELCDHYNLCDVFAMPSKTEGFGTVYLEALACGKPVLAGNQDGAVEPLAHGELGCLVDPDDEGAIADALIKILQRKYPNPIIYKPEELRQATVKRFAFPQFCQSLKALVQQQLEGGRRTEG